MQIRKTLALQRPIAKEFLVRITGRCSEYQPTSIHQFSQEDHLPNNRREKYFQDGTKVIQFPNGSVKECLPDGEIVIRMMNGDVKHIQADSSWAYYFLDSRITQKSGSDGVVLFEFPDGQVERRFPDGSSEIRYPDGTVRSIHSNRCVCLYIC